MMWVQFVLQYMQISLWLNLKKKHLSMIENNHEECSYTAKVKLMISEETMRFRKVRRIL